MADKSANENEDFVIMVEKETVELYHKVIAERKEQDLMLSGLRQENEKLIAQLENKMKEPSILLEAHKKEISEREKKVSSMESDMKALKTQIVELNEKLQELRSERDKYLELNKDMTSNIEQKASQDRKQLSTLEAKNNELLNAVQLERNSKVEMERRVNLLQSELAQARSLSSNNNEKQLKAEVERLSQELKREKLRSAELQEVINAEANNSKASKNGEKDLKNEVERLSMELKKEKLRTAEVRDEAETLRAHMKSLKEQFLLKEQEFNALKNKGSRLGMNEEIVKEALSEMKKVLVNQKNTLESRILVIRDQKVDSNWEWFKGLYLGDLEDVKRNIEVLTFHQESIVDF